MKGLVADGARLVDARTGECRTGTELTAAITAAAEAVSALPEGVVLCLIRPDAASVLRYLGVLSSGRAALLWDPDAPADTVEALVRRFQPAAVLGVAAGRPPVAVPAGYGRVDDAVLGPALQRHTRADVMAHPQLALLLGTSGSTGAPRLVRLSDTSLLASATAIGRALDITEHDVAVTALPLFYTLGLSVLHSHLAAAATVVISDGSVLDDTFWRAVNEFGVTTITGVPHTFELLWRLPWQPTLSPTVRSLCVSGGRLRDGVVKDLHAALPGHRLHVMYGQTEAGSRICVLPPDLLPDKLGSVGPPVPGTRLSIEDGEVTVRSTAVMLGYADTITDLAAGDHLHGVLHTGDRGRLDTDGHLWLSGRSGRIGKAYGVRVNLDAVEHVSSAFAPAAAVAGDDRILVWCEALPADRLADVAAAVAVHLRIHRTAVRVAALPALPRRPNGKVDYDALPA
jgi:acyl-coenzyme A synthetase/AMP-(fatty) acid ligase